MISWNPTSNEMGMHQKISAELFVVTQIVISKKEGGG
jgi:hypothetical protein